MADRDKNKLQIPSVRSYASPKVQFTKSMRRQYTILAPQMSPIHFDLVAEAFNHCGYKFEVLPSNDRKAVDYGLKYVNNDACYPSVIVVGQFVEALKSGKYDLDKTALLITQTGGGCRATNYIAFIRKALKDMGLAHIPVISLSTAGLESNPGFKISLKLLESAMMAVCYGDLFMRVLYKTRPYEQEEGAANALYLKWNAICRKIIKASGAFHLS